MRRTRASLLSMLPLAAAALASCASNGVAIKPVQQVDLSRFMGDWYVIAHIPSFIERKAYDAVESYALAPDGTVQTTFRFRSGGFDAPLRTLRPVGYVEADKGNAVWGMQFVWPFRAQYIVAYLDPDYQQTIIARDARDYAWIMARSPKISDEDYASLVRRLEQLRYSTQNLRRVPQH